MAEPLKNRFGIEVPKTIAGMISRVHPSFDRRAFLADVADGYEALELLPRAKRIAQVLQKHLPEEYPEAIGILLESLGPRLDATEGNGMEVFLYLPHVCFVAEYGLEHFEPSMAAQYELTQRFTAEFSIRPFLERHPKATLARLKKWARDESPHVRRLVSEGTRPRLPWASRLREFQRDPRPVLALLELLKDDPELYVRRSVANNLNDIGKDHPEILVETARRWLENATEERRWIVRHALRSAVKRADPGALKVLGFGAKADVSITDARITPKRAEIGERVKIEFTATNNGKKRQRILVDLRVHFVKANGRASAKVFKLRSLDLAPRESVMLGKTISLAEMTTRKHYPGSHEVDIVLNGIVRTLGSFMVREGGRKRSPRARTARA